ncbi:MAG: CCA tRNA nucleotidyltransferase [Lachnospiraceae bacterium]|nr:CCA tRNA nucleotidyltransferase [Lachnospiraceae bacterium]
MNTQPINNTQLHTAADSLRINLPPAVRRILKTLAEAGFEGYAVGGCVRDSLLGKEPNDWDITTSAFPAQVKGLFKRTIDTGIEHGTVTVMMNREGYEITTYRIDGVYEDGRHPKEVVFTPSLEEDLKRRDFTINAMAYNEEDGLVDLFGGVADMEAKVIRAVGDPMERFSEDALRMMRAVRFAAQLGYEIEENTQEAIRSLCGTLSKISAERIRTEMEKLLVSAHPEKFELFYSLGLTKIFLPEFDQAMETPQHSPHHCYSVGEHTLVSIKNVPNDRILRLTMLFHDLGKPRCKTTDETGRDHFYGHPKLSAKIALERMKALKFDNASTDVVVTLAEYHDVRPEPTAKAIRRLLSKIGEEKMRLLLQVQRADVLAQSDYLRQEKLERIGQLGVCLEEVITEQQCFTIKDLAVDGKDLMTLGYKPGKKLGIELAALLEIVLENPEANEKDNLLRIAARDLDI